MYCLYSPIVLKEDGTLWGTGKNTGGELGLGDRVNRNTFTQIGTDNDWASISFGYEFSLAIKKDGTLWFTGHDIGKTFNLGSEYITTFTQIGVERKWAYADCGRGHIVAIAKDGTLWSIGKNEYGQLGLGDTTDRNTFTQIGTDNDWKYISVAQYHVLAIKGEQEAYAWGHNSWGGLGTGNRLSASKPFIIYKDKVKKVLAVGSSSFLIDQNDTLYACGYNPSNLLGLPTGSEPIVLTFTKVYDSVLDIYSNSTFSMLKWKRNDGKIFFRVTCSSQYNPFGKYSSFGTFTSKIVSPKEILMVNNGAYLMDEDGSVYKIGQRNEYGQLANGTTTPIDTLTFDTSISLNVENFSFKPIFNITNYFIVKDGYIYYSKNEKLDKVVYSEENVSIYSNYSTNAEQFSKINEQINSLGEYEIIISTENIYDTLNLETEVEPYSVYDYIGELPEVLVYTESTDDIIVSTTTEPFDIYDEFGDSVEVLYYTDDPEVTNADLILEANWSPLDELEGDFEVVTWTDEAPETAQRVLEMKAIPKPQFIKLVNPKRIYGALDEVLVNDLSQSYRDEARYFISGTDTSKWYVWNKVLKKFVIADASSEEAIIANGMKHTDLNNITDTEWRTWNEQFLNIGIFLKDNPRDTIVSVVENVSYEDYLPRHTSTIQDTSLYILNTTAKIDIAFNGNVLKGMLSDDDLTRVQYRVILNNRYYYPADGSFTQLGESPQNIELVIRSKDIKIDDWNTLKVEFQDSFGTTDYWSTNFMGTYTGLMFKDVYGEYFSNEIGEVLKYLDFGVIIAGQTTIEHEVFLKNQYGYDVKNVHLLANTTNFPSDMTVEFSQSNSPFTPHSDLKLSGMLANNAETSFFIRLKTKLGSTPDANGSFDIIVRADKA